MASARRLLYIEFDGQVYLVKNGGRWSFPAEDDPLPFTVEKRHETEVLGQEVVYCRAQLDRFPAEWTYKDDVPHMAHVAPVVQQAINGSLTRCVVGCLVQDPRGRVLMVKSSRGFTAGMWNIPGGFVEYGEHPDEAAVREVREETGVDVDLGTLIGVYMKRFSSPYFMYGFIYDARAKSSTLRIDETEIAEAMWMAPQDAYEATGNPFARSSFEKRYGLGRGKPIQA